MRAKNWGSALTHFVSGRINAPFAWGPNDCASFCADAGIAMGCADFHEGVRGHYTNAAGAVRALRRAGFDGLEALLRARLDECPPSQARRGDVGFVPADDAFGGTVVLFDGLQVIGPGEKRLVRWPREKATLAFRLG